MWTKVPVRRPPFEGQLGQGFSPAWLDRLDVICGVVTGGDGGGRSQAPMAAHTIFGGKAWTRSVMMLASEAIMPLHRSRQLHVPSLDVFEHCPVPFKCSQMGMATSTIIP